MADDKDDAAKAKALMHQLSGVLNNPVMRSLMGSSSFGTKGEVASKGKPGAPAGGPGAPAAKPATALPGMMPMRPLPPIKPLPGMGGAASSQSAAALVSSIPPEQLAPLLGQLQGIVTELDQMMKALSKVRGGNPALKKQIRLAVGQIVSHLPALIMQIQTHLLKSTTSPEAKALPALIEQIQGQLQQVDQGLDDEKKK